MKNRHLYQFVFLLLFGTCFMACELPDEQENTDDKSTISDADKKAFVDRHNHYRAMVNTPNVVWSDSVAAYAQAWADHLAATCSFDHRPNEGEWKQIYGENLYMSSAKGNIVDAVEAWAEEKSLYNGGVFNEANYEAGHYTQMIWGKTTKIGCGVALCSNGSYIVVANYNPPGNYIGENPLAH